MRLIAAAALLLPPFGALAQYGPPAPPRGERTPGISDMGTQPAGSSIGHDLRDTRDIIRAGRAKGDLSKREARALKREARQIDALADRYGRDGLSDSERRELETRTQLLRAETAARRQGTFPDKR